jgi:hypothetical protein
VYTVHTCLVWVGVPVGGLVAPLPISSWMHARDGWW